MKKYKMILNSGKEEELYLDLNLEDTKKVLEMYRKKGIEIRENQKKNSKKKESTK